jgi:hypothetical protein
MRRHDVRSEFILAAREHGKRAGQFVSKVFPRVPACRLRSFLLCQDLVPRVQIRRVVHRLLEYWMGLAPVVQTRRPLERGPVLV